MSSITAVLKTSSAVIGVSRDFFKTADLPAQQLEILFHIALHKDEPTISEIAEAVGLTPSAVSRNVAKLGRGLTYQDKGADLLRVEESIHDRRHKVVRLTQKGELFIKEIESKVATRATKWFNQEAAKS